MKITIEIEEDDDGSLDVSGVETGEVTDEIPENLPDGQLSAGRLTTSSTGSTGFDPTGMGDEPMPEQQDVSGPQPRSGRMAGGAEPATGTQGLDEQPRASLEQSSHAGASGVPFIRRVERGDDTLLGNEY